jgi:threonine synthase
MLAVNEPDIVQAMRDLAALGLFVEPTSAITAAALAQLFDSGEISPSETTVVLLSGSGLKAVSDIAPLMQQDSVAFN